jgi:hypothetical protein
LTSTYIFNKIVKEEKMTQKKHLLVLFTLALIVMVLLSACGGKTAEEEEQDPNAAITQVVETAMAALTETGAVQSPTPSITPTVLPTNTPIPSMQPSPTISTLVGLPTTTSGSPSFVQPTGQTSSCDIGGFVKDVTIPDGTNVSAGQKFTKTWEIKNNGTCTWNKNYTVVFYGGTQLAADTIYNFTDTDIEPGENVQISVEMTAPTTTGEYISYWILRNDLGQNYFVDGSSIYVEIIVGTAKTATPTATVGPTATTNPFPTLTLTAAPTTGTAGTALNYSATATSANGASLTDSISWMSSDGQSATGGNAPFTFATAGSYTVTATVTDNGYITTKQINVSIN